MVRAGNKLEGEGQRGWCWRGRSLPARAPWAGRSGKVFPKKYHMSWGLGRALTNGKAPQQTKGVARGEV